jgi:protocatechuate 3,4-dioxygenase beta subunit
LLVLAPLVLANGSLSEPSAPRAASKTSPDTVRLCDPAEPGEKLFFSGQVLDYAGRPLSKAAVVAHHTDHRGLYNPRGSDTRVPRIRGVAVTDADGWFRFTTVRPAAYPDASQPAHIHLVVGAPAHQIRYVELWFTDDPFVTADRRRDAEGSQTLFIVQPSKGADGVWTFRQDIRLDDN